jgi:hypothetical protein
LHKSKKQLSRSTFKKCFLVLSLFESLQMIESYFYWIIT